MTPPRGEKRSPDDFAREISLMLLGCDGDPLVRSWAAVEKIILRGVKLAMDQARKEGFEQAREMAANCINELWISASDHTAQSFVDNCQIVIRALQPPREGAE